jgi:hypothetical protein
MSEQRPSKERLYDEAFSLLQRAQALLERAQKRHTELEAMNTALIKGIASLDSSPDEPRVTSPEMIEHALKALRLADSLLVDAGYQTSSSIRHNISYGRAVLADLLKTRPAQPPLTGQWQPIESAPKDGRDLIVGVDIATVWIVRSAWYRGRDVIEQQPETFDESDIGWWSYIHSVTQEKLEGIYEPTHWLCEVGETPDPYSESTKSAEL